MYETSLRTSSSLSVANLRPQVLHWKSSGLYRARIALGLRSFSAADEKLGGSSGSDDAGATEEGSREAGTDDEDDDNEAEAGAGVDFPSAMITCLREPEPRPPAPPAGSVPSSSEPARLEMRAANELKSAGECGECAEDDAAAAAVCCWWWWGGRGEWAAPVSASPRSITEGAANDVTSDESSRKLLGGLVAENDGEVDVVKTLMRSQRAITSCSMSSPAAARPRRCRTVRCRSGSATSCASTPANSRSKSCGDFLGGVEEEEEAVAEVGGSDTIGLLA